jgi:transposase
VAARVGPPIVGSLPTQAFRAVYVAGLAIGALHRPVWLKEPRVRIQGRARKVSKGSTAYAGIDTGKNYLDTALHKRKEEDRVRNTAEGHRALSAWLRKHRVKRVGIEASGGYEMDIVAHLRRNGFTVVVFQPAQVRAYAQFHLQLAKNDKIDARLIAACTAAREDEDIHDPPDERLAPLAARLTWIDQIGEDISRQKTRLETCRDARGREHGKQEIVRLKKLEKAEIALLEKEIRQHDDLARRLDLIESVAGVGMKTAILILVRMPEIGRLSREEVAALVGVAPYDDDSGSRHGERHIRGSRKRVRAGVFAAALPASLRHNPLLKALYQRLRAAGKVHKVALIACARKLLIFVNTVVARGTPWQPQAAR